MSAATLLAAQAAAQGAGEDPTPMLATIVTGTDHNGCKVLIDGTTASVSATVPADLVGRCLSTTAIGAKVIGVRVGLTFFVTDVISGGAPTDWTWRAANYGTFSASFTCPAGVLHGTFSCSAYHQAGQFNPGVINPHFDGADLFTNDGFTFNADNVHQTFATAEWSQSVSAGSHSISISLGNSVDVNDSMSWRYQWAPA